ncbi:hypothetical protein WJX84_009765 [Apatococcus fuscideae]|uniref:F-box domain-containing protein n=1 Tax=Apatococcus fuscideae TaxID=2026836 RepID=A0AAW1SQM0_9CHLO
MSKDSERKNLPRSRVLLLAPELQAIVFGLLGPRDLACAEVVCKSWFDIIHSHCIWHRQAASLDALWSKTQIGGMQTACCDAAEACSIPEARRCVADHYVAGKLQRCNATTVHLQGHTASILACSAGPGIIASASEDKTVRLWQRDYGSSTWGCSAVLKHRSAPQAVQVVSPSLVLSTSQAHVLLWRDCRPTRRFSVPGQTADVHHLACSDGLVIGAAANSGQLRGWDLRFLSRPCWADPLGRPAPRQMTIPSPGNKHLAVPMNSMQSQFPTIHGQPTLYDLRDGRCVGGSIAGRLVVDMVADDCIDSYGRHLVSAQRHSCNKLVAVHSY